MLSIKLLIPLVAGIYALGLGENVYSDIKSDLRSYQSNLTEILQQLEDHVLRLEKKIDILTGIVNKVEPMPMDCEDVRRQSQEATITSGLYLLQGSGLLKRRVYCNFTEAETWTTISRRVNEEDIFNRSWTEYKNGFGKAEMDYWVGNEMLHQLTNRHDYYLRISMSGYMGRFRSSYKMIRVGDEASQYRLYLGSYDNENSNGGDSFFPSDSKCNSYRNTSAPFSTYDFGIAKRCSETLSGGWWFTDCGCSNLNGKYIRGGSVPKKGPKMGLYWDNVYYDAWGMRSSLRKVIMEIRRI